VLPLDLTAGLRTALPPAGFVRRGFAGPAGRRFAFPAFLDFSDAREGRALAIAGLRYCRAMAASTTLAPPDP
jgi:hypothetical protein